MRGGESVYVLGNVMMNKILPLERKIGHESDTSGYIYTEEVEE